MYDFHYWESLILAEMSSLEPEFDNLNDKRKFAKLLSLQ